MREWKEYSTSSLISDNVLRIGDGYRAKNSELSASGFIFARVANINGGFKFQNAEYLPFEYESKLNDKISRNGDIVFTSKGTVGRFAFVAKNIPRFVYSPQLCYWRVLNEKIISAK